LAARRFSSRASASVSRISAPSRVATVGIEQAEAEAQGLAPCGPGACAAQDRLDAQQQLLRLEGLGHIVVGPEAEALDAITGRVAGGEHQHRRGAGRPLVTHPFDQGKTVLARHHHIQHQQVEVERAHQPPGAGRVGRDGHAEPGAGQEFLEQGADAVVVVNDEQVAFVDRRFGSRVHSVLPGGRRRRFARARPGRSHCRLCSVAVERPQEPPRAAKLWTNAASRQNGWFEEE
jgi:hypothetical protein